MLCRPPDIDRCLEQRADAFDRSCDTYLSDADAAGGDIDMRAMSLDSQSLYFHDRSPSNANEGMNNVVMPAR